MHFRAIAERPSATPRAGTSWLLLGFAALSLSVHALFFIAPSTSETLAVVSLGTPAIHVTLNTSQPSPGAPAAQAVAQNSPPQRAEKTVQTTPNNALLVAKTLTATAISAPPLAEPAARKRPSPTKPHAAKAEASLPIATKPPPAADNHAADQTAKAASENTPAPATATPAERPAIPTTAVAQSNNAEQNAHAQREALRNYLLGELRDQLSRYLTYPQRARRRGWEGEVLVELNISTQGKLQNIQLVRSSGYAPLDRSAMRSLSRVDKLSLPAQASLQRAMNLQLPVIYQLSASE